MDTSMLYSALKAGLYPFQPSDSVVGYELDIDYNRYAFWIEVDNLPGRSNGFRTYIDRDDLFDYGEQMYDFVRWLAEQIYQWYRYDRPHIIPENHIVLGDN